VPASSTEPRYQYDLATGTRTVTRPSGRRVGVTVASRTASEEQRKRPSSHLSAATTEIPANKQYRTGQIHPTVKLSSIFVYQVLYHGNVATFVTENQQLTLFPL